MSDEPDNEVTIRWFWGWLMLFLILLTHCNINDKLGRIANSMEKQDGAAATK